MLQNLPPELCEMILKYLSKTDFFILRLVCSEFRKFDYYHNIIIPNGIAGAISFLQDYSNKKYFEKFERLLKKWEQKHKTTYLKGHNGYIGKDLLINYLKSRTRGSFGYTSLKFIKDKIKFVKIIVPKEYGQEYKLEFGDDISEFGPEYSYFNDVINIYDADGSLIESGHTIKVIFVNGYVLSFCCKSILIKIEDYLFETFCTEIKFYREVDNNLIYRVIVDDWDLDYYYNKLFSNFDFPFTNLSDIKKERDNNEYGWSVIFLHPKIKSKLDRAIELCDDSSIFPDFCPKQIIDKKLFATISADSFYDDFCNYFDRMR